MLIWNRILRYSGTPGTPSPRIVLSVSSQDEDTAIGTTIGSLSVINADDGSWSFAETTDTDNVFTVTGTSLKNSASFDYETATFHNITITATDANLIHSNIVQTFTILVGNLDAPVSLVAPVVSGTEEVGSTLTMSNGTWLYSPTSYAYRWYEATLDGNDDPITDGSGDYIGSVIVGATSATYDAENDGVKLFGEVDATNAEGTTTAQSNVTGFIAVATSSGSLLLDGLSGVTGAWSTWQRLLTSYVGVKLGAIRRVSDDATLNVPFSGDDIDEAAVATFIGGSSATWTEVVSQTGGNVLASATSGFQPAYDAAVGPQSRAGMTFDGSDDRMQAGDTMGTLLNADAGYIIAAFEIVDVITNGGNSFTNSGVVGDVSGYLGIHLKDNGTPPNIVIAYNWDGNDDHANGSAADGAFVIVEWRHEGGNIYCRVNGAGETSAASGDTDAAGLAANIIVGKGGGFAANVKVTDVITFDTVPNLSTRDALVAALAARLQ